MADPEILGDGDLDVVDVATVPDRLEDAVGEPQHLEVLHRLLAEVVVEAEHLRLVEGRGHLGVQLQRRVEVVPERLLDHQPGRRIGAGAQPNRRQPLGDLGEEAAERRPGRRRAGSRPGGRRRASRRSARALNSSGFPKSPWTTSSLGSSACQASSSNPVREWASIASRAVFRNEGTSWRRDTPITPKRSGSNPASDRL